MLSLSVCAVTGVILALVLKSTGSSMGTFVSVVLCVGTAMLVFNGLISVYTRINMFTAGINQEYIKLIVKVIGISYVTEISSNKRIGGIENGRKISCRKCARITNSDKNGFHNVESIFCYILSYTI